MATDWYTKLVLTVIAASAAFLAAQQLDGKDQHSEGRFRLQAIPMARMLLRLDAETGKTWVATLPKAQRWKEITDTPLEGLSDVKPPPEETEEGEAGPGGGAPQTPGTP